MLPNGSGGIVFFLGEMGRPMDPKISLEAMGLGPRPGPGQPIPIPRRPGVP